MSPQGMVRNGLVAVKRLTKTYDMHESKFHKEVECLMKTKHKNIVRFLGYCSDTQGKLSNYEGKLVMADIRNWLLCFEYVPNGSLDNHITGMIVTFVSISSYFIIYPKHPPRQCLHCWAFVDLLFTLQNLCLKFGNTEFPLFRCISWT
jgi:serine/threonine protein kinase